MSAYDPNSDENWLKEYCVGQTTGGGWGVYGEVGNQEYRAEQRRQAEQRRREEQRRKKQQRPLQSRKTPAPSPSPRAAKEPSTRHSTSGEKTWSTFFAILGFLAGAFMSQ